MEASSPILQTAFSYLSESVRPRAEEIDQRPDILFAALEGLCERNLMALRCPKEFGGPALDESQFRVFQEEVARASGALAFLQTQHQSAGSMIAKSDNEELKDKYLPNMGNGRMLLGIGFSQLRRPGPPAITAEPVVGGYRLTGHVPWITGYSFYPEFVIGATLPSGEAVFGIVPFIEQPGIHISDPMRLAAMEAAQTVTADFDQWFMPSSAVLFTKPSSWIRNNDMINVTLQGHFAIGCARAGLDVLNQVADKKGLPFLTSTWTKLNEELENCRAATIASKASDDERETASRLEIRAWAIDLAVRCAHAAVTASSGAANSLSNPAQRIYREALVFTVSAQTIEIMEATLARLIRL